MSPRTQRNRETATAAQPPPDAEELDGAAFVGASTCSAPHAYAARMRNVGDRPSSCREFDRTSDRYKLAGTAPTEQARPRDGWIGTHRRTAAEKKAKVEERRRRDREKQSKWRKNNPEEMHPGHRRKNHGRQSRRATSGAPHTTSEHPFSSRHCRGPLGSQRSIRKSVMLREVSTDCCKFAMWRLSTEPAEGSTELVRFR